MQLGTQLWPKLVFPGKARQCNLHIPPFATTFRFPLGGEGCTNVVAAAVV